MARISVIGKGQVATVLLSREAMHEGMGEEGGIACTVAQRGNRDDDFSQTVIQVFAEPALPDQGLQVLMRCADDAHIDRNLIATADSLHDTFLQEAQQFGLKGMGRSPISSSISVPPLAVSILPESSWQRR